MQWHSYGVHFGLLAMIAISSGQAAATYKQENAEGAYKDQSKAALKHVVMQQGPLQKGSEKRCDLLPFVTQKGVVLPKQTVATMRIYCEIFRDNPFFLEAVERKFSLLSFVNAPFTTFTLTLSPHTGLWECPKNMFAFSKIVLTMQRAFFDKLSASSEPLVFRWAPAHFMITTLNRVVPQTITDTPYSDDNDDEPHASQDLCFTNLSPQALEFLNRIIVTTFHDSQLKMLLKSLIQGSASPELKHLELQHAQDSVFLQGPASLSHHAIQLRIPQSLCQSPYQGVFSFILEAL